jgi:hypothetical protein
MDEEPRKQDGGDRAHRTYGSVEPVLALQRGNLCEQREQGEERAQGDSDQHGDAASPLDPRLPSDAVDFGPPHLDADQQQIEPTAYVPAGENTGDGLVDRDGESDR